MCKPAALVHVADDFRGRAMGSYNLERLRFVRSAFENMFGLTAVLWQMKLHALSRMTACIQLQKLKEDSCIDFQKAPYDFMSKRWNCVIVQFDLCGEINYIACVDGRRKLIWDNHKRYLVKLISDPLCLCCETNHRNMQVRAIQLVFNLRQTCKDEGWSDSTGLISSCSATLLVSVNRAFMYRVCWSIKTYLHGIACWIDSIFAISNELGFFFIASARLSLLPMTQWGTRCWWLRPLCVPSGGKWSQTCFLP